MLFDFMYHCNLLHRFAPTRVEFLFRVLLGIGALFRVGTPHSSIPLRLTFRSCQDEAQKQGSTSLPRITMSLQMSLEKFIPKGGIENFFSVQLFRDSLNVLTGLKTTQICKKILLSINVLCITNLEQQKCSTQSNLVRIAENKYSIPYLTYTEQQKSSYAYKLLRVAEVFYSV